MDKVTQQQIWMSYAGISDAKKILIPCSLYFKRGDTFEVKWDLDPGDIVAIIRKRDVIP